MRTAWRLVASALLAAAASGERLVVEPWGGEGGRTPRAGAFAVLRRGLAPAAVLASALGQFGVRADLRDASGMLALVDSDGDGKASKEEYLAGARDTFEAVRGKEKYWPDIDELYSRLFEESDINGDGFLNLREFHLSELMANTILPEVNDESDLEQLFPDGEEETEQQLGNAEQEERLEDESPFQDRLSVFEFGEALREELMGEHDINRDGRIDRSEHMAAMRQSAVEWGWGLFLKDPELMEWMESLFDESDITGDGILSPREVQYAAFLVQDYLDSGFYADKVITEMFLTEMDRNKDGQLDKKELSNFMQEGDLSADTLAGVASRLFDRFDLDGDNALRGEELRTLSSELLKHMSDPPTRLVA